MRRVTEVTLRIEWDDSEEGNPCDCWDWPTLLDCQPEAVTVIGCNCETNEGEN